MYNCQLSIVNFPYFLLIGVRYAVFSLSQTLVPGTKHIVTDESGHFIHWDQPDLVIAAIRDVVSQSRQNMYGGAEQYPDRPLRPVALAPALFATMLLMSKGLERHKRGENQR